VTAFVLLIYYQGAGIKGHQMGRECGTNWGEKYTEFAWESLKKIYFKDEVNEWVILKCIWNKLNWSVWTGLIWLRIGTSGGVF
jgi:hypothetical protein